MRNDGLRTSCAGVSFLVQNNIKFCILETCFITDTDNEVITILLKDEQTQTSNLNASHISTTLLQKINNPSEKRFIAKYLNAKPINFNCSKTHKWGNELKKDRHFEDFFIRENGFSADLDSNANSGDIIDYAISSYAKGISLIM